MHTFHLCWPFTVLVRMKVRDFHLTGFSPNRLFLSREVCLPLDLVLGYVTVSPELLSPNDFVTQQLQRVQSDFCLARQVMQRQATSAAFRYNLRVKPE